MKPAPVCPLCCCDPCDPAIDGAVIRVHLWFRERVTASLERPAIGKERAPGVHRRELALAREAGA